MKTHGVPIFTPLEPKTPARNVPKRSTQKRLSNAAIMEQVSNDSCCSGPDLEKDQHPPFQSSASPAGDPPRGGGQSLVAPKMPGVAESLGIGLSGKGLPAVQKALALVGPPIKPVQHAVDPPGGLPEDEPSHWTTPHPSSDLMVNAMAQQSQALAAHFTNSDPMSDLAGGGGIPLLLVAHNEERSFRTTLPWGALPISFKWPNKSIVVFIPPGRCRAPRQRLQQLELLFSLTWNDSEGTDVREKMD